jgi:hypothetical protein
MKRFACVYVWLLCLVLSIAAQEKVVKLKIVQTSDVHGNYYPYNFITRKDWQGSLARIYAFVEKEREQYKENLILLDNGDILQGQPTAYYYNYIDTVSPHLCLKYLPKNDWLAKFKRSAISCMFMLEEFKSAFASKITNSSIHSPTVFPLTSLTTPDRCFGVRHN